MSDDWERVKRASVAAGKAADRLRQQTKEERARRMIELAVPDVVGRVRQPALPGVQIKRRSEEPTP